MWTLATFSPAVLSAVVALTYVLSSDWDSAVLMLIWSMTMALMGKTTLSSYRAGYWRGRVDEYIDDPPVIARRVTSGWQPSPWDDGRW